MAAAAAAAAAVWAGAGAEEGAGERRHRLAGGGGSRTAEPELEALPLLAERSGRSRVGSFWNSGESGRQCQGETMV